MKNLLIVVGVFVGILLYLNANQSDYSILPKVSSATVDQEQFFKIEELFDQRRSFQSMAEPGVYTVIEVYSESCGRCKRLEAGFPALLRKRDDIVIKRVETFSGRISFTSQEEADRWINRQDSMMEFYRIKGTPHVEIYDTRGGSLAKDDKGKKTGTQLLSEILKSNA